LDDKTKQKYQAQISEAEVFLNSKSRAAPRKNWTTTQQKKWLMREVDCPTCEIELTRENLTKEHIHPLCLGGSECDDNVIAMCDKCNKSRNNTMTAVVGGNNPKTLRYRWPANRTSVEEFVIWCHATVYGDLETVEKLQHLDESFRRDRGLSSSKISNLGKTKQNKEKSFFNSVIKVASKIKSAIYRSPSKVKINCGNCDSTLRMPVDYTGRFRCPSCNHMGGPDSKHKSSVKESEKPAKSKPKSVTRVPKEGLNLVVNSNTEESNYSLKDDFRKYILEKLAETGRIDLGVLSKPHFDMFVEQKGFTKFVDLKTAMGYSRNKKLKEILLDLCGDSIIVSNEQMDDNHPKTYIELAFNLKVELWKQIQDIILANKRPLTDLNYVWRKISEWSKLVGFTGAAGLKKSLGYSSKAKVVDLIRELYGNKLLITQAGEKIQLKLKPEN
jgi:5-methylcytosine-specific restriction endonuclease McrA